MDVSRTPSSGAFSRRAFLGGIGAAALLPVLAACSSGASGGSSTPMKFWDMPWGGTDYNPAVKKITLAYAPKKGLPAASYQTIQWANFTETFSSAVAAKKGPTVSSGGAFQAFQFAAQGAITYADDLIAQFKKSGLYDDFLPGTVDALKTKDGYVGIPWQLDLRPIWYRKSLLQQAGVEPPTDWNSWLTAGKALKKIGTFAFGVGSGAGNNMGYQALVALMINNGGGLFAADGTPDAVTERNIETMDFVRELAGQGFIDPGSVGYTSDNVNTQWKKKLFAMGTNTPGLDQTLGDTSGDLQVLDPPTGPHGDKGSLYYVNNLMMYADGPSKEGAPAFLTYYMGKLPSLWAQNVVPQLPALQSIADSADFKKSETNVAIIDKWQPISKPLSALSKQSFASLAGVDAGQAVTQWAQTMLAGQTDSKAALTTLQAGLESVKK